MPLYVNDLGSIQVEKGVLITNRQIAQLTGVLEEDQNFWAAKLNLKSSIDVWLGQHNLEYTIRTPQVGIRILTDVEALAYNAREPEKIRARNRKAIRKVNGIDLNQLDDVEKAQQASLLQNLINDRRALRDTRDPYSLLNLTE